MLANTRFGPESIHSYRLTVIMSSDSPDFAEDVLLVFHPSVSRGNSTARSVVCCPSRRVGLAARSCLRPGGDAAFGVFAGVDRPGAEQAQLADFFAVRPNEAVHGIEQLLSANVYKPIGELFASVVAGLELGHVGFHKLAGLFEEVRNLSELQLPESDERFPEVAFLMVV